MGDFNKDSRSDLAVVGLASTQFVDAYLSGGDGKFKNLPGPQFSVPFLLNGNNVDDVNNNGNLDTTVCGSDGSTAAACQIFLGDGPGGLIAAGYTDSCPARKLPVLRRHFHLFPLFDEEGNPDFQARLQPGSLGPAARRVAPNRRFRVGNVQLNEDWQL